MINTKDWPFFGHDGKPSVRQILAAVCLYLAYEFGNKGLTVSTVSWQNFIPMGAFIIIAGFLFGIVTMQNIQAMISTYKDKD